MAIWVAPLPRFSAIAALGGLFVVALASALVSAQEPPRSNDKSIPELVRMLGSERYQEREAAERTLTARDDAVPHLRRALLAGNAEMVRRAKLLLAAIDKRSLPRYLNYGRQGRIDVLVEWLGTRETVDDDVCWRGVNDIALELLKRSKLQEVRKKPKWDLPTAYESHSPPITDRSRFLLNSSDVREWPWLRCRTRGVRSIDSRKDLVSLAIVTTAGAVKLSGAGSSIVFANDDVSIDISSETIVVCDGRICTKSSPNTILIARKDIVVGRVYGDACSQFHAGGTVQVEWLFDDREMVKLPAKDTLRNTEITERQRTPMGVRFFETADVGIESLEHQDGVYVKKVTAACPPDKAGLQAGDIILSVDGGKCPDVETLRRQLRRAFVQDEATLSVRRGDKTIELAIPFYGFDLLKGK